MRADGSNTGAADRRRRAFRSGRRRCREQAGQHSRSLRVNTVGWVAPTHNPVRTAEYVATLDHMLQGRLGVGFVRGYQARWVHTLRIRPDIPAVGPWNQRTPEDDINRDYFKEFVDIVLLAWAKDTFSYQGRFWTIPDPDFVNPHVHTTYTRYGRGVGEDMRIHEVGIPPRELLIGDPDMVSRRIEEAQRRVPINECFLLIPQGIHDRDKILTSLELFATRVMPRF
jgi:alkanesulfonate monooxygenase SsuD/methylene tetrahydromethanopterin reductase-like flavin-dependent oxidoreductase (luciferase family)